MKKQRYRFWFGLIALPFFLLWLADRCWPVPVNDTSPARVVVAKDGTPLWRFADKEGVWRYPVIPEQVSPLYLDALINYEDRGFWYHPGVNPFSLLRAGWQFIRNGEIISGGSTLTMQVARLLEPHPRTMSGKIRQIWRAFQLEWHYSKKEILTLYLNLAPFGGTLQGIGAASWAYLGKAPSDLSYSEAALLAVLPQAPSRLRPDRWPERAQQARDKVLLRMKNQGLWPAQQVDESLEEPVWLAPRQVPQQAPLLSRYLASQHQSSLITTTIDAPLQRQLETLALNWKAGLPARTSLAILVVDHSTMDVQAWIGSADINDSSRFGHVDMITAVRSPGSVLKPFLFGMALDDGLIHPASLLQDVPRHFSDYRPGNFDTGFNGPVSMSDALVRSLNLPAVQVLEAYGPKRFAAELRNIGLNLYLPPGSEPNLSLILGGGGARLDKLVAAYSAFARHGKAADLRLLATDELRERQLMSPGAAWIIRRILAGQSQPVPDGDLSPVVPLAWKTGTSYGYRDAWAIGLNARYIIGVWVGRPDGTPTAGQFGQRSALPLLNQVNNVLQATSRVQQLRMPVDLRPDSVTPAEICWPGGQSLPPGDSNCRRRLMTWLLDKSQPPTLQAPGQEGIQGIQQRIWGDKHGDSVAPDCPDAHPRQVMLWPLALEPWLTPSEQRAQRLPPASAICPPRQVPALTPLLLFGVRNGETLKRLPGQQQLAVKIFSQGGQGKHFWFVNGAVVDSHDSTLALELSHAGHYQILVLDDGGQTATVHFDLQ
ncbi:peptidoglycan glycosyltransferase PbpC [Citrobacter sp. JGM124]|uniref:peptidoglycan glycosyltransferase PbpC n=1 Tax=Citrobacter sp. JGM124 TaxID=2799789 RepID=UPI001BAE0DC2|nr:peptidoglycan glycosyltransferase PbpC [Citrobacter sp. JGM124]MBS0849035.1 peptidoglycan glycosyltransferase PbpC [Citrobacter sp. JGM124]